MPILETPPIGDLLQDRSEGIFEGLLTPEKSNHDKKEDSHLGRMVHSVSAGVQDHSRQCNKTPHKQVDRLIDRQQTDRQMDG